MGFARRDDIVPVLERHGHGELFRAAFPDQARPVSPANHAAALQAYEATPRTSAPFDRWFAGDDGAMDKRQARGLRRFIETGGAGCHDGHLPGGRTMRRFGVTEDYREHIGSSRVDSGLVLLTGREQGRVVFPGSEPARRHQDPPLFARWPGCDWTRTWATRRWTSRSRSRRR